MSSLRFLSLDEQIPTTKWPAYYYERNTNYLLSVLYVQTVANCMRQYNTPICSYKLYPINQSKNKEKEKERKERNKRVLGSDI